MNCEQKSGVFLNRNCSRTATNGCSNCEKQVCQVHFHQFEGQDLCEDCYWEKYLYAESVQPVHEYDDFHNDTTIIPTSSSSSSSSPADTEKAGFDGGFGGGEFGGGGASGAWTEGDAQGFDETDAAGGLLDNDDTFYYS